MVKGWTKTSTKQQNALSWTNQISKMHDISQYKYAQMMLNTVLNKSEHYYKHHYSKCNVNDVKSWWTPSSVLLFVIQYDKSHDQ